MTDYRFTLVLSGHVEDHLDELFEAGCDDATFGSVDGVPYAEFEREAPTITGAIGSAIAALERVGDVQVVRIEPDDLVTASEIAERLGRTRESVRLLIAGDRGRGDFPAPVSHLRSRHRLWRWSDVAAWADLVDPSILEQARATAALNAALELRSSTPQLPKETRTLVGTLHLQGSPSPGSGP